MVQWIRTSKFIVLFLPHDVNADISKYRVYNINWPDKDKKKCSSKTWYHHAHKKGKIKQHHPYKWDKQFPNTNKNEWTVIGGEA